MTIQLPPAQRADPDDVLTPCEYPGCGVVEPRRNMWAYRITCMQTPASVGTPAHECEAGQHYGCSQEHALAVAVACAEQHMPAANEKLVQQRASDQAARQSHIDASEAAQAEDGGNESTAITSEQ